MSFKKDSVEVVRKVIGPELVNNIKLSFEMVRQIMYMQNNLTLNDQTKYYFNDVEIEKGFSYYGGIFTESLLVQLQPLIENVVGCKVFPTYSYARFCYNGAELKKHIDRKSGEFAVSINIHKKDNVNWPIYFKTKTNEEVSFELDPGDLVIYKGIDLEHWRHPYSGQEMLQVFLMYVDVNGKYQHLKYDTRPYLGFPAPNIVS
jgi:hypothetical protein